MPPFGRWFRPIVAAGAAAAIGIGAWVAMKAAQGDIGRLATKYPTVAASEEAKAILAGIPIGGGIVSFFAGPLLDSAAEAPLSDEDKKALKLDHAVVTWAPIVGIAGLAIGGILALYFTWTDVIRGPTATQVAGGAGLVAAVPLSVAPTPAAQEVAPILASASAPAVAAVPVQAAEAAA